MLDGMSSVLEQIQTGFMDLRREIDRSLAISLVNGEIQSLSDSETGAFFARAISDGGLATHCFSLESDMKKELDHVAALAGKSGKFKNTKIKFAKAAAVVDNVTISPLKHPEQVSLEEKVNLLKHYDKIVRKNDAIAQCDLSYLELYKRKWLVNSDGTKLYQDQLICFISGLIVAKDGARMEDVRVAIGGSDDFARLENREDVFENKARIAIDLLKADKVPSGVCTVLLDPLMTGLFVHESFGHFSEADLVVKNPALLKKLQIGTHIASDVFSVIDDGTKKGIPGYWEYDDEGVKSRATSLISKGVLTGRMHNRETAAIMGEPLSGNAVSESCRHVPLVRMSNIYVVPGSKSFEEILSSVKDGVYVCGPKGGQTMGDLYSFGAQYGYMIKDGKLQQMVSGINLSGNLFNTLKNIEAVGNDLSFREVGGCGKGGQINVKSGLGGPHMLVKSVTVG